MLPVFPIRLLMLVLPVIIAVVVLMVVTATDQRQKMFGRQGVAWFVTSLMIVAAIGIGYGKAHASVNPEPVLRPTPPVSETVPPGYSSAAAYVRDDANVLSAAAEKALADRNGRLLDRYDVALGVITSSHNYGPDDLVDHAYKVAEQMDLRGRDMLVVLDIRSGEYGIIQGGDLVNAFTNDDCSRYVRNYMEQDFERGNYDAAVLSVTEMLEAWYGTYFD